MVQPPHKIKLHCDVIIWHNLQLEEERGRRDGGLGAGRERERDKNAEYVDFEIC